MSFGHLILNSCRPAPGREASAPCTAQATAKRQRAELFKVVRRVDQEQGSIEISALGHPWAALTALALNLPRGAYPEFSGIA